MAKKILLVDDEEDVVTTAKIRLEAGGYEVGTSMGEATMEDARQFKPDVIILDIIMPGMDGFAVLRELKRDPELANIPVIIFSAKPKSAMIELFGPEGIAGYVSKPYDPKELIEQIRSIVGE
jgi:CheY-like chemotaxis protein